MDKAFRFPNIYLLGRDLSGIQRYPAFEQWGPLCPVCLSFRQFWSSCDRLVCVFLFQSSSRGRVAGLLVLVGVGGFLGCYFTRGKDESLGGPYKNQTVSSLLFFFWVTVDREHAWGRAAKPRNEGGSPSEEKIRLTAIRTLIWRFPAFHASLIDSCLLLKSNTISRAFFCKQTASILTDVWLEALVLFLSVRYWNLMIVS